MLPECRQESPSCKIPKFEIETNDVKNFIKELHGFHEEFHDCFSRSEPRDNFFRYLIGQFSELKRKSIEPIAINVEGGQVRSMQRFISDQVWNEDKMLSKYRNMVSEDMGESNGVLIFDETGFEKKGSDSVGVTKQYLSGHGHVANGQVGVFAAYASSKGYTLIDKRLYMPEKWFNKEFDERRKKCEVPKSLKFKSKSTIATEMYQEIKEENILPFKYVVGDKVYGQSPELLDAIESDIETVYLFAINSDTRCWLEQPVMRIKEYKYRGTIRTKKILEKTAKKPILVREFAENLNDYFWYKRTVSEGTKGPIEYEFTKRRIFLRKKGVPIRSLWLIIKRTTEDNPVYRYYISNAPISTPLKIFVWLSGIRWAIEQCFEETKTELGMDQYEVRKYRGWNHHILLCMLAHFFLWHLKIRMGKKSTSYYFVPG